MSRLTKSKRVSDKPRQVRDAEATKAQILDAAEEEFAKYGLAGARIDAIAARTGVQGHDLLLLRKQGRTVSDSDTDFS